MGSRVPMYVRMDTIDDAKSDLVEMIGWYITDEDGEPDAATIETRVTDQVAEEWWRLAGHRSEQRDMLLRLGVDSYELDGFPEVWETLYSPRTKLNPDYAQTEEGCRHLEGTLEGLHLVLLRQEGSR